LTEYAEVPVIGKQARVVEEVVIDKNVTEHVEAVRETVRRTDVEVEKIDNDVYDDRGDITTRRVAN
jgi:stress response protein YsnF